MKFGEEKRDIFVSKCSSTSERFVHSIRKATITTFAREILKEKKKKK